MNSLQNKNVLLTGATGGIGQAVLHQLLDRGANVMITGRDAEKLQQLAAAAPQRVQTFAGDLTESATRSTLLAVCMQRGGIDVLINNAGISQFSAQSEQDLANLVQTNLLAPMQLSQLFLPMLIKRSGILLNVGSTFASIGYAGYTGYCASKFGLRGYTEALQRELADSGVKVLYLAPRATKTAINSSQVDALNSALGQHVDTPNQVAKALIAQLITGHKRKYIGAPESFFIKLNALLPAVVDLALGSKLKQIKHYFSAVKASKSAEV